MYNGHKSKLKIITEDSAKLSQGFWEAVEVASEAIFEGTGHPPYKSFSDYRSAHASPLTFVYFFHTQHRHNGNIGEIDHAFLENCFNALLSPVDADSEARIKVAIGHQGELDSRTIVANSNRISTGLKLTFMALRVAGHVLLPLEFKLPIGPTWLHSVSNKKKLFTEIGEHFHSFHKSSPFIDKENPATEYYSATNNLKRLDWFAGYGVSLSLAIDANTPSQISIRDWVRMRFSNRTKTVHEKYEIFSKTPIPWALALSSLTHSFPSEISFTESQVERVLSNFGHKVRHNLSVIARYNNSLIADEEKPEPPKPSPANPIDRKLNKIHSIDIDTVDHEEFYAHCVALPAGHFKYTDLNILLPKLGVDSDLNALEYWIDAVEKYSKFKVRKRKRHQIPAKHYNVFFLYLFFYLPWWFKHNSQTSILYPANANLLDPVIFGSRFLDPKGNVPKTFVEFSYDRAEYADIADTTLYSYMLNILNFSEWLCQHGRRFLDNCNNVEPFFERDDLPATRRPDGTVQNIFPRKLFKTVVSFAYAVLEFQSNIQALIEAGKVSREQMGAQGAVLNTSDFGECPTVIHLGREYKIEKLPSSFLYCDEPLQYKDGRVCETINLGPIVHNILALETGIRGAHLLWLDENLFDSHLMGETTLSNNIYPMHVNTDKRGVPWVPVVSRRVVQLLRRQREWKHSISCSQLFESVNYQKREDSVYKPIYPVFSHPDKIDSAPFLPDRYRDSWLAMSRGLQMFCRSNNISDFRFIYSCPIGAKRFKTRYPAKEVKVIGPEEADWTDGLCCPISVRPYVKPHGARAAVVSDKITHLPAELIGKYITGQTERVVFYYAKISPEDYESLIDTQHQSIRGSAISALNSSSSNPLSATMLHAEKVNKKLSESIGNSKSLDRVINEFCLTSLDSLTSADSNNNGIEVIRNSKLSDLAYNKTHICPFGNVCPKEIIDQFGESGLCGICAYSIKSADHLPAINAEKHRCIEKLDGLTTSLDNLIASDATDDDIYLVERMRDNQALNILGWELTEEILYSRVEELKKNSDSNKYVSFDSEYVANFLERVHVENDEVTYLITRMKECIEYPSLQSPEISARFELAKRKLLAATGRLSEALSTSPSQHPAMELYSLISTIQECNDVSTAQILNVMRADLSDVLPTANPSTKFLGN